MISKVHNKHIDKREKFCYVRIYFYSKSHGPNDVYLAFTSYEKREAFIDDKDAITRALSQLKPQMHISFELVLIEPVKHQSVMESDRRKARKRLDWN